MTRTTWIPTIIAAFALATAAAAQSGEVERVPITDAQLLEELGLPPDAEDVYALPRALERLLDPSLQAAEPEDLGYGTTDASYTGVSGTELIAERPAVANVYRSISSAYCLSDTNTWAYASAQVPLPTGVAVDFANLWASDEHASHDATLYLWESCFSIFGGQNNTLLGSVATAGSNGDQIRTIEFDPPFTVGLNFNCSYKARVRFSSSQNVCVGASGGINVRHIGVRWKRQISPAPETATFGDVPTGHPFFQFVEAMADSGITAGCGGGNYCPDDPLTRGQMAVFFASALGLHWPL